MTCTLPSIGVLLFLSFLKMPTKTKKTNELYHSVLLFALGITVALIDGLLAVGLVLQANIDVPSSILVSVAIFLILLLCIALIMMRVNFRIVFSENEWRYRNFWRKEKKYSYSDIEKIIIKENCLFLCVSGKRIRIDSIVRNYDNILPILRTKGVFKKEQDKKTHSLKKSTVFVTEGFLFLLFSVAFFIVALFETQINVALFLYSMAVVGIVGGLYCLMIYSNWRITFEEEKWRYRDFWRIETIFSYSEIEKIIKNSKGITLLVGNKRIRIESNVLDYESIKQLLQQKIKTTQKYKD